MRNLTKIAIIVTVYLLGFVIGNSGEPEVVEVEKIIEVEKVVEKIIESKDCENAKYNLILCTENLQEGANIIEILSDVMGNIDYYLIYPEALEKEVKKVEACNERIEASSSKIRI